MINWLQGHVWMCTYIIMGLAIMTFALNFIIKRNKKNRQAADIKDVKNVKMKASRNKNSTVNQSARDMTITINPNNEQGR